MRRSSRPILPALLASVLFLGACAGGDETPNEPEGNKVSGPMPTVEGEFGDEPTFTFPEDDPSDELEVAVLSEGDGAEVQVGDTLVADYIGQIWDGDVFDNSFVRDAPAAFPIGVSRVIAGWDQGLVGQNIGSRVLLSIPSELGYAQGNEGAGIEVGDTIVFVVDIIDSYGANSAGEADAKVVEGALDEAPVELDGALGEPVSVTVKDDAPAPTERVTTVLAEGSGVPLEAGEAALHFAIGVWGGKPGASTWDDGEIASLTVGQGTSHLDDLVGIPVGSRVLVQVPATSGSDPMAVVVDIIAQPRR